MATAGFDPQSPTVWLIEGLLQYLDESSVRPLFERVNALSVPKSVLLYDVVGKTLLESPMLATLLEAMAEQGSPWLFGTDDPGGACAAPRMVGHRNRHRSAGQRMEPVVRPCRPLEVPDVPRGCFVEATRS